MCASSSLIKCIGIILLICIKYVLLCYYANNLFKSLNLVSMEWTLFVSPLVRVHLYSIEIAVCN